MSFTPLTTNVRALACLGAAALFSPLSLASGPLLAGAEAIAPDGSVRSEIAISGPITVLIDDHPLNGARIRVVFDEPLAAFRRIETEGAGVVESRLDPNDARRVLVTLNGISDGANVRMRVVDAVGGDGLTTVDLRFSVLVGDFTRDRTRDSSDVEFIRKAFENQSLIGDLNGDGATDLQDVERFVAYYNTDISELPDTSPWVSPVGTAHAPPNEWSDPVYLDIRDDRTGESMLNVVGMAQAESSIAPDGVEVLYTGERWRLRFRGDEGQSPITVTVSDGENVTEVSLNAVIEQPTAPEAIAHSDTYLGVAPLGVSFDASESLDAQNNIASYSWDFGDGAAGSGIAPAHTYTAPGEYTATLSVTDTTGLVGTHTRIITVAEAPHDVSAPVSEAEARRFLWQAAWGPGQDDVDFVMQNGFEAWIDAQRAVTPNYITEKLSDLGDTFDRPSNPEHLWGDITVSGEDQLRQRIAWALAQIFALRPADSGHAVYSLFIKNALGDDSLGNSGTYREMLKDITYDVSMGRWLTYEGNRRADPVAGTLPDQNYAREIQQLFTIGLWLLSADGSYERDVFGDRIPTYDQDDIEQFSRIFTGLRRNYPESVMEIRVDRHEFGATQLLDYPGAVPSGGFLPASEPSVEEAQLNIDQALDNLFHHPSHAPFVVEQLIKRTVTSNPTPGYIARVVEAYEGDGPYGSGLRGDLFATFKAILLDDEARNPAYRSNPFYGKVMEPIVLHHGLHRVLEHLDTRDVPFPFRLNLGYRFSVFEDFGQGFLTTPSVFNFYRPTFAPLNTPISKGGFVAPELQIVDDDKALESLRRWDNVANLDDIDPVIAGELLALSVDPVALVDHVDMLIAFGSTSPAARQRIIDAVSEINDNDLDRRADRRVRVAIGLVAFNPGFRHLR